MTESMPTQGTASNAKQWLVVFTYIIPLVLIYTMMQKGKESFYVWHSKNAAGAIVVALGFQVLYRVLWIILPDSLTIVFTLLNLVNLIFGLLLIYGAYQGWQGKEPNLPVLTAIGQKIPLEKWFNKDATPNQAPVAAPAPEAPAAQPMSEPAPMAAEAPEATPAPAAPMPSMPTPEEPKQPEEPQA